MSAVPVHRQTLTITNDLAALSRVRDAVRASVESGRFPPRYLNRLQIAVDEAVTNIIEHGYAGQSPGKATIELALTVDADAFRIVIEDCGQTFAPGGAGELDIESHVRSGRGGGLGVFLMRKIMDLIEYHAEKGAKNRLVLVKYRAGAAG
jgi:serine/threonine-protein kinase RsbW